MTGLNIEKVAVVGTGFMGSGIAQVSAMAGLKVSIYDIHSENARKALENIQWSLGKLKAKGKTSVL